MHAQPLGYLHLIAIRWVVFFRLWALGRLHGVCPVHKGRCFEGSSIKVF